MKADILKFFKAPGEDGAPSRVSGLGGGIGFHHQL